MSLNSVICLFSQHVLKPSELCHIVARAIPTEISPLCTMGNLFFRLCNYTTTCTGCRAALVGALGKPQIGEQLMKQSKQEVMNNLLQRRMHNQVAAIGSHLLVILAQ